MIITELFKNIRCTGYTTKDIPANTELLIGTLKEPYHPSDNVIKFIHLANDTDLIMRLRLSTDGTIKYTLNKDIASGYAININEMIM